MLQLVAKVLMLPGGTTRGEEPMNMLSITNQTKNYVNKLKLEDIYINEFT